MRRHRQQKGCFWWEVRPSTRMRSSISPRPENGGATMRYTSFYSPCGCRRTTAGGWNQCELTQLRPAKETAPMAVWFGGGELSAGRRSRYQSKCSSFQCPTTLPESSVKLKYCMRVRFKSRQNEWRRFDLLTDRGAKQDEDAVVKDREFLLK